MCGCPAAAAMWKNVLSSLSWVSICAPASTRRLTTLLCPFSAAIISGVQPSISHKFRSASLSISR